MVLGGEDGVFHAGLFCGFCPGFGVIVHGVKFIEEWEVLFFGDSFHAADPLTPGGDGIKAPMDEHPEPVVQEPFGAFSTGFDDLVHKNLLRSVF